MTLGEFITRLDTFGENLQNLTPILETIGDEVVADLRQSYFRAGLEIRSRNLYNSISAFAEDDKLVIGMLNYGLYNNYGVMPTPSFKNGGEAPITNNFGTVFRYQSRQFGLPSRQFFNQETIAAQVAREVEIRILDNSNL